jgi:hypothetical protein
MSNTNAPLLVPHGLWGFALSLLFFTVVGVSQSPPPTPTVGQPVKVEYDSSKNLTRVSMNPFVLASRKMEELRLGAIAAYPGKTRSKPNEIILIFLSLSHTDENRYDAARKLTVFADGQRLDLGETQRSKQAQNGLFIETMMARVPMDDFLLVSNAKQVKLRLGLTEIELSEPQIKILRLTASYLTE